MVHVEGQFVNKKWEEMMTNGRYKRSGKRQFEQDPIDPKPTNLPTKMNAIYTAVLIASTLAYSTMAWIGLSIDPTAEEILF